MSEDAFLPRRIVTGHGVGADGPVAKVLIDAPATNRRVAPEGRVATLLWCTGETPADIALGEAIEDMGARQMGTAPPANGSRFAVIEFPPGTTSPMHRTETIDYVVVIAGEIDMDMDDSSVRLRAGDVMVQRGTHHAWINRGTETARVAFVLIDAQPLGIGEPVTGMGTARTK